MRRLCLLLFCFVGMSAVAVAQTVRSTTLPATTTAATLQSAATANGNGTAMTVTGQATVFLSVTCTSCAGGTTVNFEVSDGTTFSAAYAEQIGTANVAETTTTAGVTLWALSTRGAAQLRARVSGYSAGTITVTAVATPSPITSLVTFSNLRNASGTELGTATTPLVAAGNVTPADSFPNPTNAMSVFALSACWNSATTKWDRCAQVDVGSGATSANTTRTVTASDSPEVAALGAKTDAKSTATDATSVSIMQVLKEISAMAQAPASTPVTGTFWQATQPISAASLPLPTGAATAAKQPALGTAGTPAADVISVQGVTSMTPLKVDGSGVTQPVSGTFWQATQPVSQADGAIVTLGAKADAKSTATDTTAVTQMQVLKEISYMLQNPSPVPDAGSLQSGAVTTAMTGTTSTQVIAAVASNYLYITHCSFSNDSASVDTRMQLQDGSGGTVLWSGLVPHGGGREVPFGVPLKVPTIGNALFVVNVTTGSSTYASCNGYASTVSR